MTILTLRAQGRMYLIISTGNLRHTLLDDFEQLSYWRLSRRTPEEVGLVRNPGCEWLLFLRSNIEQH